VHATPVGPKLIGLEQLSVSGPTNVTFADTPCSGPEEGVSVTVQSSPTLLLSVTVKVPFDAAPALHLFEIEDADGAL
jgi:hypothetical protein